MSWCWSIKAVRNTKKKNTIMISYYLPLTQRKACGASGLIGLNVVFEYIKIVVK